VLREKNKYLLDPRIISECYGSSPSSTGSRMRLPGALLRRAFSSRGPTARRFGVVYDIDGVLVRGVLVTSAGRLSRIVGRLVLRMTRYLGLQPQDTVVPRGGGGRSIFALPHSVAGLPQDVRLRSPVASTRSETVLVNLQVASPFPARRMLWSTSRGRTPIRILSR
jgi:hypothetical protein